MNTAPGPTTRIQRTAGQVGSVVVLLDLVLAFEWLGSKTWTPAQVVAVTGVLLFLASVAQNLWNLWRPKERNQDGQYRNDTMLTVLIVLLVVFAVLLLSRAL